MPQLTLDDLERVASGQPVPLREAPTTEAATAPRRGYQSPQQWRQALGLDALEDRENLPRGILTAVLTRESQGYPMAKSPKGASGLFQFMPATAQAYKIDPANPVQAAEAAATELGSHYQRYHGDLSQTLAAWNWGSGNLQKQGMANAPKETRNFITWVTGLLSPRRAEAATPAQRLSLDDLERRFGTQPPAGATTTPAPVSPPTTPVPGPPGVGPGGTLESSPADAQHAAATIAEMRQRQVPPARAALAMGQAPPAQAPGPQPVTDPAGRLATAGSTQQALHLQDLPWWAKTGLATSLGAVGAGGGAALGAMTGPAAPVAIPAFEMGGSWLARKLNVALGLEEPGLVGDVASVAVPGVLRGAGALWRGGLRSGTIPGTGPLRHEMAQEAAEGLVKKEVGSEGAALVGGRLLPEVPAAALWQQAGQHNPTIPTVDLWRTARKVLADLNVAPETTASHPGRQAANDFFTLAKRYGGPVPLQELDRLRKAIGPNAGRSPEVAQLYGALLDDMEAAAARNIPGAATLRQAIATTRKEHALETLADLWMPGKGIQQTGDRTQVYGKRIQNQFETLMKQKLFRGAWSPEEVADIRQTLAQVQKLSRISLVPAGTLTRQLGQHGTAAVAGALGWAEGGPERAALYMGTVEAFPYVMTALLSTPAGRAALRNAIEQGGGRIGAAEMGALLTTLRQTGGAMGRVPSETAADTRQAPGGAARAAD